MGAIENARGLQEAASETPIYDVVRAAYQLPVEFYPYQIETVEDLAWRDRAGYYLDVGCGKTLVSIASCLYKIIIGQIEVVVCIMPPILITGWSRVLDKIPGVTYTIYRGTPKKRLEMNLGVNFILMSYQIFKRDFRHLVLSLPQGKIVVLCDEAQNIKNVGSDNYRKVRDFSAGNQLMLLTGTPLSTPMDAYAYVKQVSPDVYRSLGQFENIHVKSRDFFNKPTEWMNLDLLKSNLELNSKRILIEEVQKDMPPVTYQEMWYDLTPDHLKLYNRLMEEQLVKFDNGEKLDLTNASSLFFALQQVPLQGEYFSMGEVESTGYEMIDEVMSELGDGKLVMFTYYTRTNEMIKERCQKYGVRMVYGGMTAKQQQASIDTFCNDPSCRLIALNYQAGGAGIDGLQHVCNDVLLAELPFVPSHLTQAVARVARTGQTKPVRVRAMLAEKTLQKRLWDNLQEKDSLINICIRGRKDLRDALAGR